MEHNKRIEELLEANRKLLKEVDSLRAGTETGNEIAREMIFKVFHAAPRLMAISNLESGVYVDVNEAFLRTLGYEKDEIIGYTSDDIQIFADMEESNKYIKLLSKFRKVTDFPVALKKKNGDKQPFLFSAETINFDNEVYLFTTYTECNELNSKTSAIKNESIINEIFETVSNYLLLFNISDDNKFYINDINQKVEEVESIRRSDVIGMCIDDTPLINRSKLIELLHHIRIIGEPHKLSVSPDGDDIEGYYMGFLLTSGDIVVTWEPGSLQRSINKNIIKQGAVFEKFAELLPEMIYEIDLNGRITYVNPQGLSYFGYSNDDFENGLTIADIFPSEYLPGVFENLKAIQNPGQITISEYLGKRKDGTSIPINTRTFGIFDKGILTGYRGVAIDISDRKKSEEQIIREKAFLENLIDSTPQAIVITDIPGKITLINKEFTDLFGYTSEEAIDKYVDDLIVPDEFKDEAMIIDNMVVQNRKEIRQAIRKDKYGNKINVSIIASAIVISDVTVAYLGIYSDITAERKNQLIQEILYNISTAALKQFDIKDIYHTIVHEISKIWDTNNFYIALYEKASKTLSLPFFADEKDNFDEIPSKGTITGWVINHNKSVLLKENDIRLMEEAGEIDLVGTPCKVWMGVPLKVESEIIGVMCLQDYNSEEKFSPDDLHILDFIANQIAVVIQRKTMLDNLILARQKAEEAALSKQSFMSTMSHEIRTRLNEVLGLTNLLMQTNPKEDQMDLIKTLKYSGNYLLTLVNDVLDYSKMESGKVVFEQSQFNLSDFLDEIKRSYSFISEEKKLDFAIVKDKNLPAEVIGDPIRLSQVLSNLISNALKFTLKGGVTVYVKEAERVDNKSKIEFIVKDTGIGIPEEKYGEIFDSFSQATSDTSRRFGGTGLGLAICKKLVELQEGSIRVESEPDKGSSFIFSLSFSITEKQSQSHSIKGLPETYKGLEGKKILVAEDNKINFYVANKFLTGWGVNVKHAENGQLALEMIEKEEFDLILMDLHMPILDGIEASRIIRNSENPKINTLPIVALTAAVMSESLDKIEDLNINDYVLKPFKPQELYDRILKHIR